MEFHPLTRFAVTSPPDRLRVEPVQPHSFCGPLRIPVLMLASCNLRKASTAYIAAGAHDACAPTARLIHSFLLDSERCRRRQLESHRGFCREANLFLTGSVCYARTAR